MRLLAAVAVAGAFGAGAKGAPNVDGWREVVEEHLARHPAMCAEDVYKLAHQATFGPAHFITDAAAARAYLLEELAKVSGGGDEPLFEALAVDPPLVRVNLRPFKARGGDPEKLLEALVSTANGVKGDPAAMRERLATAVETLAAHGRKAEADRLRGLAAEMEAKGFPALHHSPAYTEAYRPAYRVVHRGLVDAP